MNDGQENNNYLDYRFSDANLKECNELLMTELKKIWSFESACFSYLSSCSVKIKSEHLSAVIDQLLLEEGQQIKRLNKIGEVLDMDIKKGKGAPDKEIGHFMAFPAIALKQFSNDDFVKRWLMILEFEKMIHYKIAYYQCMAGWSKILRLYGVQELLEDSLDEYVHQELILNLLLESWEM